MITKNFKPKNRNKKIPTPQVVEKAEKNCGCNKEAIVQLLCDKIPTLYDRPPDGINRDGVRRLLDEVIKLL
jgi:hypothetical protein